MKKLNLPILAALIAFFLSCSKGENLKFKSSFDQFTTEINITLFDVSPSDSLRAHKTLEKISDIFSYFDRVMNPYNEKSSISKFNSVPAGSKVPIPDDLKEIFDISKNIHEYTDGSFDVAIMPLADLWNESIKNSETVPKGSAIEEVLQISNLDMYIFDEDSVTVLDNRCKIGLGGIAKGFAVDSVSNYLKEEGFSDFIIEAGGDLTVNSNSPRAVGVKHPRKKGELADVLYIKKGSAATSGDYEKFIMHNGTRYSHIIDPRTGYGTSDLAAVTVVSDKAYLSDAFATAVMVMGKKEGAVLIRDNDLSGIIYFENNRGGIEKEYINIDKYLHSEPEAENER
ncbi:MAG: FAD:protein FMN transferase [Candidatus Delongbacteria bacterium]